MESLMKFGVLLLLSFLLAILSCIPVMLLWNAAIPDVFPGVRGLDLWHAFCVTWLCVLLFKSSSSSSS